MFLQVATSTSAGLDVLIQGAIAAAAAGAWPVFAGLLVAIVLSIVNALKLPGMLSGWKGKLAAAGVAAASAVAAGLIAGSSVGLMIGGALSAAIVALGGLSGLPKLFKK